MVGHLILSTHSHATHPISLLSPSTHTHTHTHTPPHSHTSCSRKPSSFWPLCSGGDEAVDLCPHQPLTQYCSTLPVALPPQPHLHPLHRSPSPLHLQRHHGHIQGQPATVPHCTACVRETLEDHFLSAIEPGRELAALTVTFCLSSSILLST